MFDLLDRPLHWIPVSWPTLIAPENESDLSEPGKHEIELRVELLEREEVIWRFPGMFGERVPQGKPPEEYADKDDPEKWGKTPESFDTFRRIVRDWRKISANGRRVEMTDENVRLLLSAPMFEVGFVQAYIIAIGGETEIREKNLPASPGDGRGDASAAPAPKKSRKTANASA